MMHGRRREVGDREPARAHDTATHEQALESAGSCAEYVREGLAGKLGGELGICGEGRWCEDSGGTE